MLSSRGSYQHRIHTLIFLCLLHWQEGSSPLASPGIIIALIVWTFVGTVMSRLFNTLSRFVIAFLQRSKHLLISWLQLPCTVILGLEKIKYVTASTFPPSICHGVLGPDAVSLIFLILSFKPALSLSHPYQEALQFLCTLCHWSGTICTSEVVDISPSSLGSSL